VLFPRVHLHKLPPDLCHTIELAIERQGVGELDKSVDDAPVLAAGLRAYHDWHVGEPDHNSDGAGAGMQTAALSQMKESILNDACLLRTRWKKRARSGSRTMTRGKGGGHG